MTDRQDTLDRVCRHLQRIAGTDAEITPDSNLVEKFALDSVKVLDLLMEIEDEFDLSIPLNAMADVQTVNDLVDVIVRLEQS